MRVPASPLRVDVVLPVKDAVSWVLQSIDALFSFCGDDFRRLIIVDDGSTPESLERLQARIEGNHRIDLLHNAGRPGYGGACNVGAAHSDADIIAFLNSDCLLSSRAIHKMAQLAISDPSIGMVCPLSNNSPVLTLPLAPGASYHQMNEALERALADRKGQDVAIDACTVVGTCLLVTKTCWETTGEFDPVWGLGYGEETDFQFRAMRKGFRGVAAINTYVYHYGGASFGTGAAAEQLRQKNHQLFLQTWGGEYKLYAEMVRQRDPVTLASKALLNVEGYACDVLFIVPGLDGSVGGHNVVCDICNALVQRGIPANVAVLGMVGPPEPKPGGQPMLFGPSYFFDIDSLVSGLKSRPSVVVATLFSTSLSAFLLARRCGAKFINFVQGHEFLFENGRSWHDVRDSYDLPDEVLVTSGFLEEVVKQKTPDVSIKKLPVGVDTSQFFPKLAKGSNGRSGESICIGFVLRSAPDKGQPMLLEIIDRLRTSKLPVRLKVFSANYHFENSTDPTMIPVEVHALPLPKATISERFRDLDIFVDASLHEGFGLFPLEAMASGATVVCSDSGGVREFVAHGTNGFLVPEINKPDKYFERVEQLVTDKAKLGDFKRAALGTAQRLSAANCMPRYLAYFSELIGRSGTDPHGRIVPLRPVFSLARVLGRSFIELRWEVRSTKLKDQPWIRMLAIPIQHELFRPQYRFNIMLLNLLERLAAVGPAAFTGDWARNVLDPLVAATGIELVSTRTGLEREFVHFSKRQVLRVVLPALSVLRRGQKQWNQWAVDCVSAIADRTPLPDFQKTASANLAPSKAIEHWVSSNLFKHQDRFNACMEGLIAATDQMAATFAEPRTYPLRAVSSKDHLQAASSMAPDDVAARG